MNLVVIPVVQGATNFHLAQILILDPPLIHVTYSYVSFGYHIRCKKYQLHLSFRHLQSLQCYDNIVTVALLL